VLEVEPQLIAAYVTTGKVRIVVRPLLQTGADALLAAHAAECANEQNAFVAMRRAIYDSQGTIYMAPDMTIALADIAEQLTLDRTAFSQCMSSERYNQALYQGYTRATESGIVARPVFDVNGQRLVGSQSFETFQRIIDGLLAPDS
jgi:protein-disulfide isomerase